MGCLAVWPYTLVLGAAVDYLVALSDRLFERGWNRRSSEVTIRGLFSFPTYAATEYCSNRGTARMSRSGTFACEDAAKSNGGITANNFFRIVHYVLQQEGTTRN